jgi:formylglycine-generating enzyme required for sulfatase activity
VHDQASRLVDDGQMFILEKDLRLQRRTLLNHQLTRWFELDPIPQLDQRSGRWNDGVVDGDPAIADPGSQSGTRNSALKQFEGSHVQSLAGMVLRYLGPERIRKSRHDQETYKAEQSKGANGPAGRLPTRTFAESTGLADWPDSVKLPGRFFHGNPRIVIMFTPSLLLLFVAPNLDAAAVSALQPALPPAALSAAALAMPDQGSGKSKKSKQAASTERPSLAQVNGLVEIPKGKFNSGISEKDASKAIAEHPDAAQPIGAKVGNHSGHLERFFIGPTEVTNEMYLRYVKDTGAMPPPSWANFTRDQRLAIIQEIQKKDKTAVFDEPAQARWWQEHWQDGEVKWGVSAEEALMPVGFISHRDATEYCKWAGLRLPTEDEWVRAARDDKKTLYPSGAKYDATSFAHEEAKPRSLARKMVPVASLSARSSFGLADMSGNLWEWTDSPFRPLEGFDNFRVKTKAGTTLDIAPNWDAASRIIKGGSYYNQPDSCTVDTRVGLLPHYRANILGFRVASSAVPCENAAMLASRDVSSALLGGDPATLLAVSNAIGLEISRTVPEADLEAGRGKPKKPLPASKLPEGYQVFDRYDCLTAIPMNDLNVKKGKLERTVEEQGPIAIGALHSTVAFEKAGTLAGTYIMMYVAPLEAEIILDLKATLPPKDMIEDYKPKELAEDEIPITDLWPAMEGLTLKPGQEYVLLVDKENKGVGLLPLIKSPKFGKIRSAESRVRLNLDRNWIEYEMSIPSGRNDAWSFRFTMVPRGKDGSLTRRDSWDGDYYEIVEPKEKK